MTALFSFSTSTQAQTLNDDARANAVVKALAELEKCRTQVDSVQIVSDSKDVRIEKQKTQRWIFAGVSYVAGILTIILIQEKLR